MLITKVMLTRQMEERWQHVPIVYCWGCRVARVPGCAGATPEMDSRLQDEEMQRRHLVTLTNAVLQVALWWAAGVAVRRALMWRSRPATGEGGIRHVTIPVSPETQSISCISYRHKSYLLSWSGLISDSWEIHCIFKLCFLFDPLWEWKKNVQHSAQRLDQYRV